MTVEKEGKKSSKSGKIKLWNYLDWVEGCHSVYHQTCRLCEKAEIKNKALKSTLTKSTNRLKEKSLKTKQTTKKDNVSKLQKQLRTIGCNSWSLIEHSKNSQNSQVSTVMLV